MVWLVRVTMPLGLLPALFSTVRAAETITIEKLQPNVSSYHLKVVTLQGTAHQIQVLAPPDVADGDTVTVDAQITVTVGNTADVLAVSIRK